MSTSKNYLQIIPVLIASIMFVGNAYGLGEAKSVFESQDFLQQKYYQLSMKQHLAESDKLKLPLYSWSLFSPNINNVGLRKYIQNHNSKISYNPILSTNTNEILKGFMTNLDIYMKLFDHKKKENDQIQAINTCTMDLYGEMELLLDIYNHKLKPIVVDIGSGNGSCAKELALAGYEVFSVDKSEKHIEFQKESFCIMPDEGTFIYQYWKKYNPEMLDKSAFDKYCEKAKNENIHFINGNFIDKKTLNQLPKDKKWDIVLALHSLQFFDYISRSMAFHFIHGNLKDKGLLFLSTQPRISYEHQNIHDTIYDFDLKQELDVGYLKNFYIYTAHESTYNNDLTFISRVTLGK